MGEEKQAEYALGSKVIERFLGDEYFPDKWCPFNALEYMDVNEKTISLARAAREKWLT